jgi:Zn-dependent protease with chaperone function/tetratricopeptide (TPR) repeat protein
VFALVCAAGATILLFYVFAALSVVFLLGLLACELVFVVAAARFGLGGPMARVMTRHMATLPVFFRSFWIKKGSEFRVALKPDEAPKLFKLLQGLCERAKVALPREILLEMSVNAWVRLAGYRRGAGKTTLGIGYDLLAGLSETEIEAVLAHEVTHARLVQRGLNKWLRGGLNRAARLAGGLAGLVEAGRKTRQPSELAAALLKPSDWFARTCARLVAACSRQDEFAADLGAAELCGADALRSALMKLEIIGRAAARLPWRERVAQLQLGEGFGRWLVSELTAGNSALPVEAKAAPFDKYATHPSLRDRLAALAGKNEQVGPSPSALGLLAEPDRTAEELMAEIQRVIAREEQGDTKRLDRWSRKVRSHSRLHPLQLLGVVFVLTGFIGGLVFWLSVGMSGGLLAFVAATIIPGILFYRFSSRRERVTLPVPDFSTLKAAFQVKNVVDETKAKEAESTLRKRMGTEKRVRRQARLAAEEAYAALGQCDYLRAHVAARLCLQLEKQSVEGMIGLAVAAAALGQTQQFTWALQALQKRTQITRGSAAWGAAWALLLTGNWSQAEAFLRMARKGRSEEPPLLALQALCQARRGKLQSAISSARQACTPKPPNQEYSKLLMNLLLDGGFLREAEEQLAGLETDATTDAELMFSLVRLNLMRRNSVGAEEWTERLKRNSAGAHTLVRLGGVYESCRRGERATGFYTDALVGGHFPEALLGLGRLEAVKQNKENARGHLLAALDLERSPAEGSCGPLPIFQSALEQLLILQEPTANCVAWIATLNGTGAPVALANKSLMVFAPNREEAEQSLSGLLGAMRPGRPPVLPETIAWRQAPQEQQPFGLARPGVQGVLG